MEQHLWTFYDTLKEYWLNIIPVTELRSCGDIPIRSCGDILTRMVKKKLNCSVDFFLLKRETVKKRHVDKMKRSIFITVLKSTLSISK